MCARVVLNSSSSQVIAIAAPVLGGPEVVRVVLNSSSSQVRVVLNSSSSQVKINNLDLT